MSWYSFRKGLQTVHLWAGLILSVPFILLGLSGSVLLLQPEVPRFSIPYAPGLGKTQSVEHILKAAQAAAPQGMLATRISLPQRPGEPASVRYATPGRAFGGQNQGGNVVYVDAVTLKILGTGVQARPAQIFQFARQLHATLFVDSISGRKIVGWLGIAWTLLMLSGVVLWWPKPGQWRSAFGVKRGSHGVRLNRDLHSAFGFWTALLMLGIGFSGLYLTFPSDFRYAVGTVLPLGQNFSDNSNSAQPPVPSGPPLDLDQTVVLAETKVRDAEPIGIQPALRSGDTEVLTLAPNAYGVGGLTALVIVDPKTRTVTYVDDPRTYAIGEQFVLWQRQVHSGLGFGFLYKALVFSSGFLPLLFAITGVRMWWLKRTQRRTARPEAVAVPAE